MSTHYEGVSAAAAVRVAGPGVELGHDVVPEGEAALVVGEGSTVLYVQGRPVELRAFIDRLVDAWATWVAHQPARQQ